MTDLDLRATRGLVATVVLTGTVESEHSWHMSNVRSHCDREGFHNVEWRQFQAVLVEAGRDAVVQHALNEKYDWLIMVDADAAPLPVNLVPRLLETAFVKAPDSDIVGTYCQLKGNYLPTIDTGSGTWEPHFPNSGILPVIRTGAHCFIAKTRAFQRFGPPWFRTRRTLTPAQAMAEVDNYARIKLSGKNPFTQTDEWQKLLASAKQESLEPSSVGEDSGMCDALKAAGGEIYVDTSIVVGHVAKKFITPADLKEKIEGHKRKLRLACGVMG